jgi:hypothetical protein
LKKNSTREIGNTLKFLVGKAEGERSFADPGIGINGRIIFQ